MRVLTLNSLPNKKIDPSLLALTLALSVASAANDLYLAKFFIALPFLFALLFRELLFKFQFWVVLLLAHCTLFYTKGPYLMANFHYTLIYFHAMVALALCHEDDGIILDQSSRLLFLVVMGMATLHKLFSPAFFYGDFFFRYLVEGRILNWPLSLAIADFENIRVENLGIYKMMVTNFDYRAHSAPINLGPPALKALAIAMSWAVIVFEAVLSAAFIWFHKSKTAHWLFLLFLFGTLYLKTGETFYLSTMGLLGLAQCPPSSRALKLTYLSLLVVSISIGFNKQILQ